MFLLDKLFVLDYLRKLQVYLYRYFEHYEIFLTIIHPKSPTQLDNLCGEIQPLLTMFMIMCLFGLAGNIIIVIEEGKW